jgi:hypothetical protein
MLEGGNTQLSQFFTRHKMSPTDYTSTTITDRYKTKAASFYKQHLAKHVTEVAEAGVYLGREASREASKKKKGRKKREGVKVTSLPTVEEVKDSSCDSS